MKKFVVLSILIITFLVNSSCKKSYYNDYLIPEGYVGWVRIIYGVKDAPPLPIQDGRYIYKFDESGVIKTSTPFQAGWEYPRYYYYSKTSKRPIIASGGSDNMIWDGVVSGGDTVEFFVGTLHENSLWSQSKCGKEQEHENHTSQNIKQCLEDYETTKESEKRQDNLDVFPDLPVSHTNTKRKR